MVPFSGTDSANLTLKILRRLILPENRAGIAVRYIALGCEYAGGADDGRDLRAGGGRLCDRLCGQDALPEHRQDGRASAAPIPRPAASPRLLWLCAARASLSLSIARDCASRAIAFAALPRPRPGTR